MSASIFVVVFFAFAGMDKPPMANVFSPNHVSADRKIPRFDTREACETWKARKLKKIAEKKLAYHTTATCVESFASWRDGEAANWGEPSS